jgi:hypothetical protein
MVLLTRGHEGAIEVRNGNSERMFEDKETMLVVSAGDFVLYGRGTCRNTSLFGISKPFLAL